jgi:triacylglycerol lipase
MDRKTFHAELAKLGREFSPELVEKSNALVSPLLPAPDEARTTRDIAYGEHERHRLNLFRPQTADPVPCLLFVHDGGFVMGDKGQPGAPFYNNMGAWAQREGLACVTINYRLAPEVRWPSGREDVIATICHVAERAGEYGIDPQRIVIMGHSAGATHVADVVAEPGAAEGKIAGAVLSSGFYDLATVVRDPFKPQYYGAEVEDWSPMSPLPGVVASDIPCMVSLCELDMDECQRQAMTLAEAWIAVRGTWPNLHVQAGHNHMTACRQVGSDIDSMGPLLAGFIASL